MKDPFELLPLIFGRGPLMDCNLNFTASFLKIWIVTSSPNLKKSITKLKFYRQNALMPILYAQIIRFRHPRHSVLPQSAQCSANFLADPPEWIQSVDIQICQLV